MLLGFCVIIVCFWRHIFVLKCYEHSLSPLTPDSNKTLTPLGSPEVTQAPFFLQEWNWELEEVNQDHCFSADYFLLIVWKEKLHFEVVSCDWKDRACTEHFSCSSSTFFCSDHLRLLWCFQIDTTMSGFHFSPTGTGVWIALAPSLMPPFLCSRIPSSWLHCLEYNKLGGWIGVEQYCLMMGQGQKTTVNMSRAMTKPLWP